MCIPHPLSKNVFIVTTKESGITDGDVKIESVECTYEASFVSHM